MPYILKQYDNDLLYFDYISDLEGIRIENIKVNEQL